MNYIDYTKLDLKTQYALLATYEDELKFLPKGRLERKVINKTPRFYIVSPKSKTAKYSSNIGAIYDLKRRRFLEESIRRIKSNIALQECLLRKYRPYDCASVSDELPLAYKMSFEFSKLQEVNFPKLKHLTSFGLSVRSKSELIIAELLHAANINFEYEKSLTLKTADGSFITVRPDFTIYLEDRTIYWEHMGMMAEPEYRQTSYLKLTTYFMNDIFPPENLIITMDSRDGNLDISAIQKIVFAL